MPILSRVHVVTTGNSWSRVGRAAFLAVAAVQGWILFGGAIIGVGLPLGFFPNDPSPAGTHTNSACAADALNGVILALVGAPIALGFFAMLNMRIRARSPLIAMATLWMIGVAVLALYAFAAGLTLPSRCGR